VRTLPPVPRVDAFARPHAPLALADRRRRRRGAVRVDVDGLSSRRVVIDSDRIRVYRGLRPFPRVYPRPTYGRAIRIKTSVYIAKSEGIHVMNPTASPVLTEAEAKWLTSEMKRALGQS
jgi:hypothetical protein